MNRARAALPLGIVTILVLLGVAGLATRQEDADGSQQPFALERRALPRPSVRVPRISVPNPAVVEASVAQTEDWLPLVDRPWIQATTGWQVLADYDTPLRNTSFVHGPLVVAGQVFARGISTYPFSEISYDLNRQGLVFSARIGVTDDSRAAAGSVRFLVYGDEYLLYESDVVRATEPALTIDVNVEGLQELRLVVDDAGDGSLGDYALWAEPMVLTTMSTPRPEILALIEEAREEQAALEAPEREAALAALRAAADDDRAIATRQLRGAPGSEARFDPVTATFVLANSRVIATFGVSGVRNGRFSLLRQEADVPTLFDAAPSIVLQDGRAVRLADLQADRVESDHVRRVQDPVRGPSSQILARFRLPDGPGTIVATLTLPDDEPILDLRLMSDVVPLRGVRYLDIANGAAVLGETVKFISDRSHLYWGTVRPDGHLRPAPLESTKPALIWSTQTNHGLLLSFFDYTSAPAWLSLRRQPGREEIELGLELEASADDFGPAGLAPPALSIELTDGPVGAETFSRFRRAARLRYPAISWPAYARYQWGSWYVYGPGVSAAGLQRQMDLLAANFTDLGPWLFAIDAGWYVQYGREDAELTTVDTAKFPNGIRGVADAAHARGMKVILYLGTGFVHDSTADGGEWLALRGLIDRYPQWLIPFQCEGGSPPATSVTASADCVSPSGVRRYLLDYANPEVRAYLADIIRTFFTEHGADGILLDGVADAEGQLIPRVERDTPSGPAHPLLPTLDLYRFIREQAAHYRSDAFLESGWLHPTAADPYLSLFWYGDDTNDVDGPYPFAGFFERLDYALFSRLALGQRPYLGTASDDPARPHARWRVQAAAALGAHATLGYDLGRFGPATVAAFRADLTALDPFQGATTYGPGLPPDTFATTREGVTYLGIVNREHTPQAIVVPLAAHGLADGTYTAFTVASGTAQRVAGDLVVELPARSFRLLVVRREPGLLWTDSVATAACGAPASVCRNDLAVTARGPAQVPGFMHLATPPPNRVSVNGADLRRGATAAAGVYTYDEASGLLSLAYSHQAERRIEVRW